ncbi:MAG: LPS export ABC transporter periplasmic protein LptC [Gammaproteobacteria bacterium]
MLFGILVGAALLTWVLARVAQEAPATRVDRGPASEGYYLIGAVMHGTDEEGRIYYRIKADRVEQQEDGGDFVLERMSVEYMPETDIHWNISAARGLADVSRESLSLQEGVRLVYLPDTDQEGTVFETENLQVYTDEFLATTDQEVTMRKGRSEFTATGLELNLKTDFWKLGSNVAIRSAR